MDERCQKMRALLEDFLDEELTGTPPAELSEHLSTCPACRAELEQARRVEWQLRTLPRLSCPEELSARIEAAVEADLEAGSPFLAGLVRGWPTAAAMAAAVAVLALLVLLPLASGPPVRRAARANLETLVARQQARASLVLAAQKLNAANTDAIRLVIAQDLPHTVSSSLNESLQGSVRALKEY